MENYMEELNCITNDGGFTTVKSFAVGDQKVCTNSLFSLNIKSKPFGTPTAAENSSFYHIY